MSDRAASAFAIDGLLPHAVAQPVSADELARAVATAFAEHHAIVAAGNGTQLHIGRPPLRYDLALSTQRLNRILAHEAADMTVTVEAGITLAALNAALASARQRLPLDPPYPERTTIGAVIATDACGPLRLSHGKVRDLLIGITVVLADGTRVHGGGRVVKNVAGYDLMKLFTGSFGTLGIVAEATFKLRPVPETCAVFVVTAAATEAALVQGVAVLGTAIEPEYLAVVNRSAAIHIGLDAPAVVVGCAGSAEEVAVQEQRLTALAGRNVLPRRDAGDATAVYTALRDFPAPQDDRCGCRISILPSQLTAVVARLEAESVRRGIDSAIVAHAGSGVAFFRWSSQGTEKAASFAAWVRETVRAARGWTLFDLLPPPLKAQIDPWDSDPPGLLLMRGIKQTLDPGGRLSPGRFVGGI